MPRLRVDEQELFFDANRPYCHAHLYPAAAFPTRWLVPDESGTLES
jgi:hypothetical protein